MSFIIFIKLLLRNWLWLTTIPVVTAVSIFYFTRKQDKEYAADTVIYTGINSGFNLKDETRADYYSSSKAFANFLTLFNSRHTRQEVAFHLLARHLSLKDYDPTVLGWHTYVRLHELINKPLREQLVGATLEETVHNIAALYNSNDTNVIYKILNSEEQGYSLKALSRLSANQISNSDLMKVDYVTNDAAMCRQTLEILSEVFIRQHTALLEGQNESVLDYFQTATAKSARRLEAAEKELLAFQKKNNIINFEEQANQVAHEKQRQQQDLNALEMEYAGTLASLREIERTLKKEGNTVPNSQEILQLRHQLSDLNTRITEYEIFHKSKKTSSPAAPLAALKKRAEATEAQLQKSLDTYSARITSLQNLPVKEMLNEWMKDAVQAEKLKGQLVVMRRQNQTFAQEAEKVAPLGVELRKIEREKELAEKEYFNLLNGLTQSKLTQQNIALTSQLKVVDPPITPLKALSSKRIVLVLAGAMGSFIALLAGIVGAEFLDASLKTPFRAARQTGLGVFGVLPRFAGPVDPKTGDQLARKLLLKRQQKQAPGPYLIGVLSHQAGAGKTTLLHTLARRLQAYKIETQVLLPDHHSLQAPDRPASTLYSALRGLAPQAALADLVNRPFADQAVVLVEFPALLEAVYPVSMLQHLDLVLLTVKADRTWQQEDQDILARIRQVTAAPMEIVLNGLLPRYSEAFRINLLPWRRKKETPIPADTWLGEMALPA
jgi:uncharacterized protein involved in exopolysaccharide biosynthesis/tRNA A37 threonylcarbamoyladenosine biosynthesis protein TsaE